MWTRRSGEAVSLAERHTAEEQSGTRPDVCKHSFYLPFICFLFQTPEVTKAAPITGVGAELDSMDSITWTRVIDGADKTMGPELIQS